MDSGRVPRELVAPVPQCGRPELLETLDHAGSEGPDLGSGTGLLSKVATEEEESGGRGDGVGPTGSVTNARIDLRRKVDDSGQSDHEEGDGKENPGDGENDDRGLVSEETVPDEREEEENSTEDVEGSVLLVVGSGQERHLVRRGRKHLTGTEDDTVQRPLANLPLHGDLEASHGDVGGVVLDGTLVGHRRHVSVVFATAAVFVAGVGRVGSVTVRVVAVIERRGRRSKGRVPRRALVRSCGGDDLVLLDVGKVLSLALDEELLDAEVGFGVVGAEQLELLDEVLRDVSVGVRELRSREEKSAPVGSSDRERARTHVDNGLVQRRARSLVVHDGRDTLDARHPRVDGERSVGRSVSSLDKRIPRSLGLLRDPSVGSSKEVVVRLLPSAGAGRLGRGDVLVAAVDAVGVVVTSDTGGDRRDGPSARVGPWLSEVLALGQGRAWGRVGGMGVHVGVLLADTGVTLRVDGAPGHRAGEVSADPDRSSVEVLGSLSPLDDGESLDSRSGSENGSLLLGRFEGKLDRLGQLREHVLG